MATTSLKLSAKTDVNGKSQVIVKLTVSRTNRPCFKSGVYIMPTWFKSRKTTQGNVYNIEIPKKGRLNASEVAAAENAKTKLGIFISRLTTIANVLAQNESDVTHDKISEALELTRNVSVDSITYECILNAKRAKELQDSGLADKTFFGWMEAYLNRKELSEGRKRGFRVLVRMLSRYQSFVRLTDKERKDFTLDVHTIDRETIEDFFDYMANEKALSDEYPEIFKRLIEEYPVEFSPKHKNKTISERGHNIIVSRKKYLKLFFNWLLQNKYTTNKPFADIKIGGEVYGTPFFLTLEERNVIAEWDFSNNKHLEAQRDIFIFQTLIGCRVSDLMKMTKNNLVVKDGVLSVEYIPRKTKDNNPFVVNVPLNDRAKSLIEKYADVDIKGKLFPFISTDKYNDAIKAILTACGIKRVVTVINPTTGEQEQRPINEIASSHMARRTFVGNLYCKVKDPNLIGKLSGHVENSSAFLRYRNIDSKLMKETVSLID